MFDPICGYDWQKIRIPLPNALFSNSNLTPDGDKGDGILDVFDRYNFTVKEDEPLEKDVAVDPEMLGKVFENLLNTSEKKAKGAFYTPREIVHYMCRESLMHHLNAKLAGAVSQQDIAQLIAHGDAFVETDARIEKEGRETQAYSRKLPKSIAARAKDIDDCLAGIRVCDPAVGSGAFAVGMMNEIIRLRRALTPYLGANAAARDAYALKRHAIHHSLYGVDIDPGAAEIAKTRLWLSLVVDEDTQTNIQPLPNLDYKIVQGNALLSAENQLLTNQQYKELAEYLREYFNETDSAKKRPLKNRIDHLMNKLTDNRRQFNFGIYFPEVFHRQDGGNDFDLVIANPPYVRADSGEDHLAFREQLANSGLYQTLAEKWDMMVPFIEKGIKITNAGGNLVYIVSNAICTAKYGYKLLDWIQGNFYPYSIDYFDNVKVFNAGVTPVILQLGRTNLYDSTQKITRRDSFDNIAECDAIPVAEFKALAHDGFRKNRQNLAPSAKHVLLRDICYISNGLQPNSDEKLNQGAFKARDIISKTKDDVHCMPFVEGKNIDDYLVKQTRWLEWGTDRVPGQLRRKTFPELFSCPKILRGRVTGAVYDDTGITCSDGVMVFVRFIDLLGVNNNSIASSITKNNKQSRLTLEEISEKFDLKYILAILNSDFAYGFLNSIRRHRLPNYFYAGDMRQLPIADISKTDQQPLIALVDQLLAHPQDEKAKTTLNQMVTNLYTP